MSGLASAGRPVGRLWPLDASVLGLLAEHEVLSTSQLVWLTGVCERTVQHRLGRLAGAGLVGRLRPPVVTGSSPYLCWRTPAGATAVGAGTAVPADRSTARVSAVAALSELWLGLRARAAGGGLNLVCWQRTPDGLAFPGRAGVGAMATDRLRVDARFVADVSLPAGGLRRACGLVWLDTGQLPGTRLAGPLRRFARLLTAQPRADEGSGGPVLLVLTRTAYRAEAWLTAARDLGQDGVAGRVDGAAAGGVGGRLAVCVSTGPSRLHLTGPVWRQPHTSRPVRLTDVLVNAPVPADGWGRQ